MKQKEPTKEEIARAIKKFQDSGHTIKRMPPQKFRDKKVVGEEKYEVFESIHAFSSLL